MVASNSTVSPDSGTYRVDVVHGEQETTYQVLRCELVARFDNEEHAAFLVELMAKGRPHD